MRRHEKIGLVKGIEKKDEEMFVSLPSQLLQILKKDETTYTTGLDNKTGEEETSLTMDREEIGTSKINSPTLRIIQVWRILLEKEIKV